MKRVRAEQAGAADGVPKTSVGWKAAPRWSYTSIVPKEKKIKECVIFVLDFLLANCSNLNTYIYNL